MTSRPWRAVASLRFGPGIPAVTLSRTSAKTRAGLDRFLERHTGDGAHVEVWEIQPIPEVARLTQVADSDGGYGEGL